MIKQFLEAGKIINTHGIRGDVKIQPWTDSPKFLTGFKVIYIDDTPVRVISARQHKDFVIMQLEGIDNINVAMTIKNKVIQINRDDAGLSDGSFFLQDLIGTKAVTVAGEDVGVITDILTLPSGNVYVISGSNEHLVPAVPEFIKEVNIPENYIKVNLIEGM